MWGADIYRASRILAAGGSDPVAFCEGSGLEHPDTVPVRPAPRWMSRFWRDGVSAMTLPHAIFVDPNVLVGDPKRLAKLISHELVHVRQWRRMGVRRFVAHYLVEYGRGRMKGLSHRSAYLNISLEREARQIAGY